MADKRKDVRSILKSIGYRYVYKYSDKIVYAIRNEKTITNDTWVDEFRLARGEKLPIDSFRWVDMYS